MNYRKPNILCYRIAQAASFLVSKLIFRCRVLRNEIKGKKGPFVVIANHGAALDFVNLICATGRPMTFVISNAFYSTLPIKGFLDRMGVIPKQQFQTAPGDLKKIKNALNHGQPVVIYPAGLMCEDGLSTPIPPATYKFLKWLGVDVYAARSRGSYFVMPKWATGLRPGKTTMDIYRLFSQEELAEATLAEIRKRTDAALLFDAYREQEDLLAEYKNAKKLEGLQNVLYLCPHCGTEFSLTAQGDTLRCCACGFSHTGDRYGFLHNTGPVGRELRYVSDWSQLIFSSIHSQLASGALTQLSAETDFYMIDKEKNRFVPAGTGTVCLDSQGFCLEGVLYGQPFQLAVSTLGLPTLPFSPGKYFEVQHGRDIYRCVLKDGRLTMKFIHMVKARFSLNRQTPAKVN